MHLDIGLRGGGIRRLDGDVLKISGVASNWNLDSHGDRLSPRAFDSALERYRKNPILLFQHQGKFPLGRVTEAVVKADGLHIAAELPKPPAGTEAFRIWALVRDGFLKGLSIGGHGVRDVINGVKTVVEWRLSEISIVSQPANESTLFSVSDQIGKAFDSAPTTRAEVLDLIEDQLTLLSLRVEMLGWRLA